MGSPGECDELATSPTKKEEPAEAGFFVGIAAFINLISLRKIADPN